MHPKTLASHTTSQYSFKTVFDSKNKFRYVISYVHDNSPEFSFPILMHNHSFCEINIITSGSGWHYMENNCIEATEGSVYAIPENFNHGYYSENPQNFKILHILLSPYFIERYKSELQSVPGFTMFWEVEPYIREGTSHGLFLRLTEKQLDELAPEFNELVVNSEDKPENNIQELSKALDIISKLSSFMMESHKKIIEHKTYGENADFISIVKTMEYMKQNYWEKITVDDLIKIANMSRTNYIVRFKALSHFTPNEYLTSIRIEKASEMLLNTDKSISTIAQDCGFFDSSHFNRTFYKMKNATPLQYRKNK